MTGLARLALAFLLVVSASGIARAEELMKAKIGVLRLSSSAPVFIAQHKGYFRDAGLDVELKFFDAAQPIAVATTSGDVDFGITAFTAGLYNLAGKGTLKVIGGMSREKAGKSTLLSILGGLLQPVKGSACLRGAPPPDSFNPLTFVFQDFALLPWCTVEANVEFPLLHTALAASARRALVADALRRTGLTDFRAAHPKQLSGGMRQRVGIARALAVKPAILLMDEPLSALDSQTRELLMEDFIRLLADGAMGAVYVTHNLEEALRLADRIVVLSRRPGRIREVVAVPVARPERTDVNVRGKLLGLQNELWSLIRSEAIDAEREVQHA